MQEASLFELLCDPYTLQRAWMEVHDGRTRAERQRGAGVDGVTVADWEDFCQAEGWRTIERAFLATGNWVGVLPNLRAEVALYLFETPGPATGVS